MQTTLQTRRSSLKAASGLRGATRRARATFQPPVAAATSLLYLPTYSRPHSAMILVTSPQHSVESAPKNPHSDPGSSLWEDKSCFSTSEVGRGEQGPGASTLTCVVRTHRLLCANAYGRRPRRLRAKNSLRFTNQLLTKPNHKVLE